MKSKSHFKNMTMLFIVGVLLCTNLFLFVKSFVFAEADENICVPDSDSIIEWPVAKQNLIYNGENTDLLDTEFLDNLPGGVKIQFTFEPDGEWLDLNKDCLPQKKDAGVYEIYLRAIDDNGDIKKIFDDGEKNYIEVEIEPKSLKISGEITAQNKVYDGISSINLDVSDLNLDGVIADDDVCLDQESLENLIGEASNQNAGIKKRVHILNSDKLELANNELGNYILEEPDFDDLEVNIYKRKIKIDGSVKIQDKEYDGNNLMSFDTSKLNLVGVVDGDNVILDPESLKNIKCETSDKNVGIGKTVRILNTDEVVLANNEPENYVLGETDWNKIFGNQTVEIKPKELKISGNISAKNKIYNGNNSIELNTDNLNLDGIIDGDDVILDPVGLKNLKGETENKNAGTKKKVRILNLEMLSLANNELGNYILEKPEFNDLTVDVYKRKIKMTGKMKIHDKEYDGEKKVNMKDCYCAEILVCEAGDLSHDLLDAIVADLPGDDFYAEDDLEDCLCDLLGEDLHDLFEFKDDLKIETGSLAGILDGDDYSVGNDKKVRIYGSFFLAGKDKLNYELIQDFDRESTVNIKPREIKIMCDGEIEAISQEYNGLLDVDLDFESLSKQLKFVHAGGSKIGIIKGDDVKIDLSGLKGTMEDKKIGQNKKVNITGTPALIGTDKDNYKLIFWPEDVLFGEKIRVNIEPKVLNLNGNLTAIDKIYDQTNLTELDKSKLFLEGKIENDDVNLNLDAIHGFVEDASVGNGKKVEIVFDQDILRGIDIENYILNCNGIFDDIFVNILARELNINGDFEIEDRFYDGTNIVDLKTENIKLDASNICDGDCVELKLLDLLANTKDKNAGKNKDVEINGTFVLEGEQAKNYVLNDTYIKRIFGGKKINIKKLPAEFIWSEKKEFEYDGNQHEIKASVKNKKSADDMFNLKYDNNVAVEEGNYVAKVISLGNENYSLENAKNTEQKWVIKEFFVPSYSGNGGGGSSSSSNQSNNYIYDMNKSPDQNQINNVNNMIDYSKKRNLGDILIPERIKQKKYLSGYNDKTFKLDDKMTRAEFLQAVYNLINNNESINSSVLNKFTDVDKNAWYAKALAYLSERKIVNGYGNKSRINDFITRGEMAKILFDVLVLLDNNSNKNYAYGNCDYKFVDLPENYWATEVIKQLASNGMINGYEDKTFRAQKNVTCAEAVATIEKIFVRDKSYAASKQVGVQKQHL